MLNETFSFIVELYFGYHICIDPIRASLCLHFLSVIFVLWLCLRVSFLMSVLSVGLSIILLLADAAGQPAHAARDLRLCRAPPCARIFYLLSLSFDCANGSSFLMSVLSVGLSIILLLDRKSVV